MKHLTTVLSKKKHTNIVTHKHISINPQKRPTQGHSYALCVLVLLFSMTEPSGVRFMTGTRLKDGRAAPPLGKPPRSAGRTQGSKPWIDCTVS
mmetsp:Transcript_9375/g.15699  ORF Transcript_9375/g.15699 Transcript_9375/m.15699 type:complete len:93 (-) Transcript_9375:260-538(-)